MPNIKKLKFIFRKTFSAIDTSIVKLYKFTELYISLLAVFLL